MTYKEVINGKSTTFEVHEPNLLIFSKDIDKIKIDGIFFNNFQSIPVGTHTIEITEDLYNVKVLIIEI